MRADLRARIVSKARIHKDKTTTFAKMIDGSATDSQIRSLLMSLRVDALSVQQLMQFSQIIDNASLKMPVDVHQEILDIVGSGGDKKSSFNVSTASAIVAVGAGCIVAKYGSRSLSTGCGTADVFEALGVNIEVNPQRNSDILSATGLVFLFAPLYNPALLRVAKIRKEIGTTIFNAIAPITNPLHPSTYLLGAYSEQLAEKLSMVLLKSSKKKALVVHGAGYDEISLTGKSVIFEIFQGKITKKRVNPEDFGFKRCSESNITISNPAQSASAIKDVLSGKMNGPMLDIVLLNAGAAIYANMRAATIKEGIAKARESIYSGNALEKLILLIRETNQ